MIRGVLVLCGLLNMVVCGAVKLFLGWPQYDTVSASLNSHCLV